MSEVNEVKTPVFENKLSNSFFGTSVGKAIKRKEQPKTEISTRGINRRFTEQWDIKFSM
jgi:hypothetical protein